MIIGPLVILLLPVAQDAVSEAEAGVDAALAASELPVLCNWGLAARIEGKPGSG